MGTVRGRLFFDLDVGPLCISGPPLFHVPWRPPGLLEVACRNVTTHDSQSCVIFHLEHTFADQPRHCLTLGSVSITTWLWICRTPRRLLTRSIPRPSIVLLSRNLLLSRGSLHGRPGDSCQQQTHLLCCVPLSTNQVDFDWLVGNFSTNNDHCFSVVSHPTTCVPPTVNIFTPGSSCIVSLNEHELRKHLPHARNCPELAFHAHRSQVASRSLPNSGNSFRWKRLAAVSHSVSSTILCWCVAALLSKTSRCRSETSRTANTAETTRDKGSFFLANRTFPSIC